MKVKTGEKVFFLQWKYSSKEFPRQTTLIVKNDDKTLLTEVTCTCHHLDKMTLDGGRHATMRKMMDKLYPYLMPTVMVTNKVGQPILDKNGNTQYTFTAGEKEINEQRREMRRLWWTQFLSRKPRITKRKLVKALPFLTKKELSAVISTLNIEVVPSKKLNLTENE